jgi:hypothetical protein
MLTATPASAGSPRLHLSEDAVAERCNRGTDQSLVRDNNSSDDSEPYRRLDGIDSQRR